MPPSTQFSLILGGGGLKGLAHIGVLRALEERDLVPEAIVGCSMGALIAASWATRMPMQEMEDVALTVPGKNFSRTAHFDMGMKGMLPPAIYRSEPLEQLIDG